MALRPRRIALVLLLVAGLAGVAALLWLPFDPFEAPAAPLDALIPRTVDSAWRLDGASFLASPFARTAWESPEAAELGIFRDVEERLVAPMGRIERALAEVSLGLADPPSVEGDLAPREVVVATRGGDLLVATRISSRARAIELLRRLPASQLAELGVRIDGPAFVVGEGAGHALRVVRHRDVLLLSTSAPLLDEALAVAERGTGGLDGDPGWADALRLGAPAGPRILGWMRPAPLAARLAARGAGRARGADAASGDPEASDPPAWRSALAELLAAKDAEPIRVELDLSEKDALAASWTMRWTGGAPAALEPLRAATSPESGTLAARARAHAPLGETIVAGGMTANASAVVRALLASQPPERQSILEEALAATGESLDSTAASLAAHLEDGVGFVVARLRETDDALQGGDAGLVHAIPATLVVFRLRGAGADRAVLDALRRRAETLFGRPLGDSVEVLGDGARIHTLRRAGLAGEWELLRPAFAFRGDEFLFSTHEGFLRRALAAPAPDVPPPLGAGSMLVLDVAAAPLRRWIGDQAWEAADRATWRDWAAERRAIERSIPADSPLRSRDFAGHVDRRIREMKRFRREREIPAAAEAWRNRWTWLDAFGGARVSVDVRQDGVEVRARVTLAGAK